MAAPAWRSRTADPLPESNTYGTTLSPTDPPSMATATTGMDVQFMLEAATGFGNSAQLPTLQALPAGWTEVLDTGQRASASDNRVARVRISAALATAADPSVQTNVDGVNLSGTPTAANFLFRAVRWAVSGANTARPVRAIASTNPLPVLTSFTMPGITPEEIEALIHSIHVGTDDNAVSAQALANGPTLTERLDSTTTTGGDQQITIATGATDTTDPPTATGAATATIAAADATCGILMEVTAVVEMAIALELARAADGVLGWSFTMPAAFMDGYQYAVRRTNGLTAPANVAAGTQVADWTTPPAQTGVEISGTITGIPEDEAQSLSVFIRPISATSLVSAPASATSFARLAVVSPTEAAVVTAANPSLVASTNAEIGPAGAARHIRFRVSRNPDLSDSTIFDSRNGQIQWNDAGVWTTIDDTTGWPAAERGQDVRVNPTIITTDGPWYWTAWAEPVT